MPHESYRVHPSYPLDFTSPLSCWSALDGVAPSIRQWSSPSLQSSPSCGYSGLNSMAYTGSDWASGIPEVSYTAGWPSTGIRETFREDVNSQAQTDWMFGSQVYHAAFDEDHSATSASTDTVIPLVPYTKKNSAFKYHINVSFLSTNGTVGIHLSDVAYANCGDLANGDCLIFDAAQNVPQKVSFRMEWPGYNKMYHQQINMRTASKSSTAIKVRKLAQVVALQFEQMKKECIASGHGCSNLEWAFFPDGPIQNDNIILAGIKQVSQGTVEPIFYYRRG